MVNNSRVGFRVVYLEFGQIAIQAGSGYHGEMPPFFEPQSKNVVGIVRYVIWAIQIDASD